MDILLALGNDFIETFFCSSTTSPQSPEMVACTQPGSFEEPAFTVAVLVPWPDITDRLDELFQLTLAPAGTLLRVYVPWSLEQRRVGPVVVVQVLKPYKDWIPSISSQPKYLCDPK